jgi:two-component system LytT family response regulator
MTHALQVALADDEALARKRLLRLLGDIPDVNVVLVSESGDALLRELDAVDVDVLLLDVQMPGLSGIETQLRLGRDAPYVIYVTAHPEHAIHAFDAGAVDYVLKPVEADRLARALERVRGFLARAATPLLGADRAARIPVETHSGISLLAPEQITHASFDGQLVTLHLRDREVVTDRSLSELEQLLEPHGFERVHRRYLLNLHRVVQLEDLASGGYTAHCEGGVTVPVSRQVARQLRRRLLGHL